MLFYDSPNPAPNPRRVRIFAAEKGIELPSQEVSIPKREQKSPEFMAKNPRGQTPALELDDGTVIAESVAICRYLEALHPRCSAALPKKSQRSICGCAASNLDFIPPSPPCFATRTRR